MAVCTHTIKVFSPLAAISKCVSRRGLAYSSDVYPGQFCWEMVLLLKTIEKIRVHLSVYGCLLQGLDYVQSTQREHTEAFAREQSLQTPVQNINADVGQILNTTAPVFQTDQSCGKCEVLGDVTNVYSSLTKFIMKKELSLSRLSTFDDKAEFYNVWKHGFKETVRELDISPVE